MSAQQSAENGLPEFGGSLGTPAPADFPKPPAENDVLDVLRQHRIGAFNGSQSACDWCRRWMTHDEYRQHLAALIVTRAFPSATTEGGDA